MSFCFVAPTALPARSALQIASHSLRTKAAPTRRNPTPAHRPRRSHIVTASASGADTGADAVVSGPYTGMYGEWYLTQGDVSGVTTYRLALAGTACATVLATILAVTVGQDAPPIAYDLALLAGAGGLGVALQTIHIYMRPLHNLLRACWAAGTLGTLVLLAAPATGHTVATAVHDAPALLLATGWLFVALTGLFVKEAVCFGRREALALIPLTPVLVGGKFLGVVGGDTERVLSVVFAALFAVFAARKFQQPATDDLGDKSVFDHLARGGTL